MADKKAEAQVAYNPFEIQTDVRDVNIIPFPVEARFKEYQAGMAPDPWHIAKCVEVKYRQFVKEKPVLKEGVVLAKGQKPTVTDVTDAFIGHCIDFKFSSPDDLYSFTHTMWEQDPTKDDWQKRLQWDTEFLAHLWGGMFRYNTFEQYFSTAAQRAANNDEPVTNFEQRFRVIEKIFNTANNGQPVFLDGSGKPILYRIKLVLWENDVRFPRFDNFIEPYSENVVSRLTVKGDDNFEFVKKAKTAKGATTKAPAAGAGAAPGGWPADLG